MMIFPAARMTVVVLTTGNEVILLLVESYRFLLWKRKSFSRLRGNGL